MIRNENFNINEKGHLSIESVDSLDLASEFSTPLYVVSRNELLRNIRTIKTALNESLERSTAAYASKALACKEIFRIIDEEGLSLDVASSGELATAMSVEFPAERIYFHGNNKNEKDIRYALECGIGCFVIDNLYELRTINRIAIEKGIVQKSLLRVKPGVSAHTHHHIITGAEDSKFGLPIERTELYAILDELNDCKGIKLTGIHCHIGSQITEFTPFIETAGIMISLFKDINDRYNFNLDEISLGGGFGIPYLEDQKVPASSEFIQVISESIKELCGSLGISVPRIIFEPGRSIIGSAGMTLYTIGSIKRIKDIKTYVAVDGGMADNIRYALYQADYVFDIAGKVSEHKGFKASIAGRCCETGDLLGEDVLIQTPETGDVLAVYPTGAYNYSMASNYNRLPRPAMVMVDGDKAYEIVRRETIEDLLQYDI